MILIESFVIIGEGNSLGALGFMFRSIYEYCYFYLYQWAVKLNGEKFNNNYHASIMLTLILLFNAITIFLAIDILVEFNFSNVIEIEVFIIISAIAVTMVNYRYFTYRNRYLKIIEHYKRKNLSSHIGLIVAFLLSSSLGGMFLIILIGM